MGIHSAGPYNRLDSQVIAAQRATAWALETYPQRVVMSCSFGGPSGMALLDLAVRLEPRIPVFCLDTQVLFPQTYALIEHVEQHYGIQIIRIIPARTVAEQAADEGPDLWSRDPNACCNLRKVEPLRQYLQGYDAWLTAIRRSQTLSRARLPRMQWEPETRLVKVAPLVTWSDEDVWAYIDQHEVPVNVLHFEGYPSIGCTHCTRPVAPNEHVRAGRWPGFEKTECGIHAAGNFRR